MGLAGAWIASSKTLKERAQNPNEPDSAQMMYVLIYTFGNMCMSGSTPLVTLS